MTRKPPTNSNGGAPIDVWIFERRPYWTYDLKAGTKETVFGRYPIAINRVEYIDLDSKTGSAVRYDSKWRTLYAKADFPEWHQSILLLGETVHGLDWRAVAPDFEVPVRYCILDEPDLGWALSWSL